MPPINKEVWQELIKLEMDLWDVVCVLEYGYDCPRSRRKKSIVEKCIRKKNKIIKVVVELKTSKKGNEYWKLRHVGMFGV